MTNDTRDAQSRTDSAEAALHGALRACDDVIARHRAILSPCGAAEECRAAIEALLLMRRPRGR